MIDERGYGSHTPVLKALAKWKKIERVIEFGSGEFSTKTFLNKVFFPDLKNLFSLESVKDWADKTRKIKDQRLEVIEDTEKELLKKSLKYNNIDLVFVDGYSREMRIPTALFSKKLSDITVFHDAEKPHYKEVLKAFKYVFIFKEKIPWTAVLSDTIDLKDFETFMNDQKIKTH